MHHSRRHTLVHGITVFGVFSIYRKKNKQLTNASIIKMAIIKMGFSGDLLGGFRGIATIETTQAAASVKIFKNPG